MNRTVFEHNPFSSVFWIQYPVIKPAAKGVGDGTEDGPAVAIGLVFVSVGAGVNVDTSIAVGEDTAALTDTNSAVCEGCGVAVWVGVIGWVSVGG